MIHHFMPDKPPWAESEPCPIHHLQSGCAPPLGMFIGMILECSQLTVATLTGFVILLERVMLKCGGNFHGL